VADGIAMTLLSDKAYMARRLALFDRPPPINLETLRKALPEARRLNEESRAAFALLTDLTTFIHVADIVRIDFRPFATRISFVELKSGRVNEMLLEELDRFEPTPEHIAAIDKDVRIDARHKAQAKRMLRQQMRVAQVRKVMDTDTGIDIKLHRPIQLTEKAVLTDYYDGFLSAVISEAEKSGIGAGTVSGTIHLGAGRADSPEEADLRAKFAVSQAARGMRSRLATENTALWEELTRELVRATRMVSRPVRDGNQSGNYTSCYHLGYPARPTLSPDQSRGCRAKCI
jgi:hypothetical protein